MTKSTGSREKKRKPQYFLAKTDPQTYSIDDLEKEGTTPWDGVHNYQAINVIKSWQPGDYIFIYHSQGEAAIVGLAQVVSKPEPDQTDKRGISWYANVTHIRTYAPEERLTLKDIKATGNFNDMKLVRQSRLSTMDVPDSFVEWISKKLPVT